jgi:beta-lactamase class A
MRVRHAPPPLWFGLTLVLGVATATASLSAPPPLARPPLASRPASQQREDRVATALPPPTLERVDALIKASGAEVGVAVTTLEAHPVTLFLKADESFHAASTMKVPVMIELFRQAAAGMLPLDTPVRVVNRFASVADGSAYTLEAADDSETALYRREGQTETAVALCESMITVSSNLATNILIERLGVERIRATVEQLGGRGVEVRRGVEDDKAFERGLNNTTTARGLMTLLARIARLEAVDARASRQMIEILKRQKFNEGIPAGVPPGIAVAHKTGVITKIHHDAGIVYGPRPFVLVLLVRGLAREEDSARLIADLTRSIFDGLALASR